MGGVGEKGEQKPVRRRSADLQRRKARFIDVKTIKPMKKLIILLLILPIVSCVRVEDLSYDGIESVQVQSVGTSQTAIDLFVRASNGSGTNLTVARAELTLKKGDRTLVQARVDEKVKLPRKFDGTVRVPVNVRFEGGMLGAIGVMSTLSRGVQGTTVSGVVVARAGLMRKKYVIEDMETERFLRQFGIKLSDILQNIDL